MNPPKGPAPASPPPPPRPQIPKRSDGVITNTRAWLDEQKRKPPYLKFAFKNPYNLSLLAGTIAAAALTLNPVIALAAVGLEAIWLLHAPDSKKLRELLAGTIAAAALTLNPVIALAAVGLEAIWLLHAPDSKKLRELLWDPQFERTQLDEEQKARQQRMQYLAADDQRRVSGLIGRKQQIEQLASQNPSFTGELLRAELSKADRLVDSFLEMALTCNRYDRYLESVDLDQLERDRRLWESRVRNGKDGEAQTEIAKKNFAIILKRLDKLREIKSYLSVARGQLDLIENSFQLIADQIVTMNSPAELSGQLDELLDGVESIKQTAIDTEKLLGNLAEV